MPALRRMLVAALLCAPLTLPPAARAASANVAALQVALHARGLYAGTIDGVRGPATTAAVLRFQRRARLHADGIAGPATRRRLGWRGRPRVGARVMRAGLRGWDAAALQFRLARHGFPSGPVDGVFGARSAAALRRFQVWAGLSPDGLAGPATTRALRRPVPRSPIALRRPVTAPIGDRFGPRGTWFHTGLDFTSPAGAPVVAAASGRVVVAGWRADGYGIRVVIDHGRGLRTWSAHLSSASVGVGATVRAGARIGRVGSTGRSTGPHLHFEVRVRGAAVDPASAGLR